MSENIFPSYPSIGVGYWESWKKGETGVTGSTVSANLPHCNNTLGIYRWKVTLLSEIGAFFEFTVFHLRRGLA